MQESTVENRQQLCILSPWEQEHAGRSGLSGLFSTTLEFLDIYTGMAIARLLNITRINACNYRKPNEHRQDQLMQGSFDLRSACSIPSPVGALAIESGGLS